MKKTLTAFFAGLILALYGVAAVVAADGLVQAFLPLTGGTLLGALAVPAGTPCSKAGLQIGTNVGTGLVAPNANQVAVCANTFQVGTFTSGGLAVTAGFALITGGPVADGGTVFTSISGSSYTITGVWHTVDTNASTNASLTLTTPASPTNEEIACFATAGIVTSLTITGNAGASVAGVGALTTLAAGSNFCLEYQTSNTTWYRIQ